MFNHWYVIVIALIIYNETNAVEKLTRQCTASKGRCAQTKDSNCEISFGSGWIEKGKCCRRRPCCVYILVVQCEDISPNNLTNGAVTVPERTIGSTANFTCDAGHSLVGNETITCTSSGWNGSIPQCRSYFWIGLTDNNDEMSYKWLSGEQLNYSNWFQGPPQQPDNKASWRSTDAHCAMIQFDYFFNWGDEHCSEKVFSVVKFGK
ncbi:Hypothetical predicted protein [Mytilus galloprovincialis]|uniref:Uncharacterized protein n=1 Tax=Mytilus galloprovincialis TaxID=29158 RepID=A0A8B6F1E2_MYTGA|nr:Hypothetical predicted protein [Mytilus galloprovincialis]